MFRFLSRLSQAFSTTTKAAAPMAGAARFESLEQRALFSATVALDTTGTLNIVSDAAGDRVNVSLLTRGTPTTDDDTVMTTCSWITFTPGSLPVFHSTFRETPARSVARIVFRGNDGSDTFVNNTLKPCVAYGGNGNDVLTGGGADDLLVGDAGNDTLSGRAGNDRLYGLDGNDVLDGGSGFDRLYGGNDNDTLDTGADFDLGETAFGQGGVDTFKNRFGDGTDRLPTEPLVW